MTAANTDRFLDEISAMADWFLEMADDCIRRGDHESGLKYTHVAAWVLKAQNRKLFEPRIEANLRCFAVGLPPGEASGAGSFAESPREQSWLHVLDEALPFGGHTAMAVRWMTLDPSSCQHSVALLGQGAPVPVEMADAVQKRGGTVHLADPQESFLQRARWLRDLARKSATHVVLHIDVDGVMAGVAFAAAGGPRVLCVNHAAHLYWTGASVVDLVINCRGSQLELDWTRIYRGVARGAALPIPVEKPAGPAPTGDQRDILRKEAKAAIGLPQDALLILTSGDTYKYLPANGLDFVATGEEMLRAIPQGHIVAVGAKEDARWKSASERTGGRLRTVGRQPRERVPLFQQAADIYIEGFPFGSTTALLEAGIRGLPAVLAPVQCPPPYATDGLAVDEVLQRPGSIAEYQAQIIQLAGDPELRKRMGDLLAAAVLRHHTGAGWSQHLETALRSLPAEHAIYPAASPIPTPENIHRYWTQFARVVNPWLDSLADGAVGRAFNLGLQPRLLPSHRDRTDKSWNKVQKQILSAIGDNYYRLGESARAREFYARSLAIDPRQAKVRAKRTLLLLGPVGSLFRGGLRLLRGWKTS